jgi:hypothetical protein
LHWNIATADRNIANSLKGFAKLMRKIPNELRSQKRNASRSLPVNKKESKIICMREFEMILFQTQSLSIKFKFSFIKNILKHFRKRLWLNYKLI